MGASDPTDPLAGLQHMPMPQSPVTEAGMGAPGMVPVAPTAKVARRRPAAVAAVRMVERPDLGEAARHRLDQSTATMAATAIPSTGEAVVVVALVGLEAMAAVARQGVVGLAARPRFLGRLGPLAAMAGAAEMAQAIVAMAAMGEATKTLVEMAGLASSN